MTKRMLIDATHAEETRVVVLDGQRLEDFDVETAAKKQLKGNIYLAKVVRVEPSLQAAFVEYGGGRHGFLAFGEIHPDYYQIPVADRQRLLAMQEAEARAEEEAEDAAAAAAEAAGDAPDDGGVAAAAPIELGAGSLGEDEPEEAAAEGAVALDVEPPLPAEEMARPATLAAAVTEDVLVAREQAVLEPEAGRPVEPLETPEGDFGADSAPELADMHAGEPEAEPAPFAIAVEATALAEEAAEVAEPAAGVAMIPVAPAALELAADASAPAGEIAAPAEPPPADEEEFAPHGEDHHADTASERAETQAYRETENGSDEHHGDEANGEDAHGEDRQPARPPSRFMRSYKIQEVIRRRQILLVQVVKEERGNKGAALTTYISLAGRFSVLMPNSPRGGGISRKITSATDRRRLKEVTTELQIPRGMGLIVRTAGAARPKAEIKRDCEYLLDLWDSIRETTMASVAPALIHEEANLIRRAIRDNYSRDVDEVLVDGEAGWRAARDFMRMLMPAHARKVALWNEPQPLFSRHGVEAQLDAMLQPTVQLRSGGYLVINQTEALVAIDVNSGRSTRERGIEETALKTNLEAADEVARQLRLRDLAGLVVIDFIDMESRRNNTAVEKRMKDALKDDRARIQMAAISHFGLMELSRQRLRPSLAETSFTTCPHCGGTGHVRTTEMAALAVLRQVEDEGAKRRSAAIVVHVAGAVALYILNHKRVRLGEIEARHGMSVAFAADDTLLPPEIRIEKLRGYLPGEAPQTALAPHAPALPIEEDELAEEAEDEVAEPAEARAEAAADDAEASIAGETAEEAENGIRKRRRRRRGGRRDDTAPVPGAVQGAVPGAALAEDAARASGGDAPHALDADAGPPQDWSSADQPDLTIPPFPGTPAQADPEGPALDTEAQPALADGAGEAAGETPGEAGDEDAKGRRRGRRGGRRRRREPREEDAAAEPESAPASFTAQTAPPPTPAYTGPTPANPFGGDVFDLFDMVDEAELPQPSRRPDVEAIHAEAVAPVEAAPPAEGLVAEEPVAAAAPPEVSEPEPEPSVQAVDMPAAATLSNGSAKPPAAPEPVSSPVPPPVLVGVGEATSEKKRGWWRR